MMREDDEVDEMGLRCSCEVLGLKTARSKWVRVGVGSEERRSHRRSHGRQISSLRLSLS